MVESSKSSSKESSRSLKKPEAAAPPMAAAPPATAALPALNLPLVEPGLLILVFTSGVWMSFVVLVKPDKFVLMSLSLFEAVSVLSKFISSTSGFASTKMSPVASSSRTKSPLNSLGV